MTIKDLKPGMKVFIKEDLKVGEEYGIETFVEDMKYLTGLQQVTRIGNKIIGIGNRYWRFTSEMIDWDKTKELNKKYSDSVLVYDGATLEGQINGKEIKVTRSDKDKEDLEKAVMMALLKSLGVTYVDVKELKNKVKKVWRPAVGEYYYFVTSDFDVVLTRNTGVEWEIDRINVGNFFKTKEEAEKKAIEIRKLFNQ